MAEARSGTISLSYIVSGNSITGWIYWVEDPQSINIQNNTSQITLYLRYKNDSTGALNTYSDESTFYLRIKDGNTTKAEATNTKGATLYYNKTTEVLSLSYTAKHKDDGSLSLTIEGGGALIGTVGLSASSGSGTAVLTNIPRATKPTLPSTADAGTTITITLPRKDNSYTHRLYYKLGDGSYTEITNANSQAGDSCTWTIPMSLCDSLTTTTSGTITVKCETYNSGTQVGTAQTAEMTMTVPSTVKPTATMTTSLVNENTTVSGWGVAIKTFTKLSYSITGTGSYSSTIAAYEFQGNGETKTTATGTTGALTSFGAVVMKGRVQDSRGRWSDWASVTLTVYDYALPEILDSFAYRVDANGDPDEDGTNVKVKLNGQVAAVGQNAATVKWRKRSAGGSWGSWTTITNNTATVISTFSKSSTYEVELGVWDDLGNSKTIVYTIATATVTFHAKAGGNGIGIGKYCEHNNEVEIDPDWDVRFKGNLLSTTVTTVGSLDTTVSAINAIINAMADYVVEQGTSGDWTYRKWNSGKAECWGKFDTGYLMNDPTAQSLNTMTDTTTNTVLFISDGLRKDFPTGLFNATPIAIMNVHAAGGLLSAKAYNSTTASTLAYQVWRSNHSPVATTVICHAFGTWR